VVLFEFNLGSNFCLLEDKNLLLCLELGVEFWNRMKYWFPKNFASIIVIEVKGVASSRDVIRAN